MICDKETFNDRKDAVVKILSLKKRNKKHEYRTYTCDFCGSLHITTITKNTLRKPRNKYPIRIEDYPVNVKPEKIKKRK